MNADSSSVLITGASTGIGHSTATRLAEEGWRVFAGVRDTAGVQIAGVDLVELDVTSAQSIASALEHVRERTGGRLDALVNNAGIPVAGAVETVPVEDFRALIETNLIGAFAVTKAFLPLVRHARGRIVFVGSLGGRVAFPYASAYHASKFGIEGLAESLRSEMRPLGVNVSVIEPATMATEIWGKGREQLSAVRASLTPEQREVYGEALEGFDRDARLRGRGRRGSERGRRDDREGADGEQPGRSLPRRPRSARGHAARAAAAVRGVRPRQEARRELTSRARWCSASAISARVAGESLALRRLMKANAS